MDSDEDSLDSSLDLTDPSSQERMSLITRKTGDALSKTKRRTRCKPNSSSIPLKNVSSTDKPQSKDTSITEKDKATDNSTDCQKVWDSLIANLKSGKSSDAIPLLYQLNEVKADVNGKVDEMDNTLLHLVVTEKNSYLTAEVLNLQVDMFAKNKDDKTALDLALENLDPITDSIAAEIVKKMDNSEVRKEFAPGTGIQFKKLIKHGFKLTTKEVLDSLIDVSKEKKTNGKCEAFYEILEADFSGNIPKDTTEQAPERAKGFGHNSSTIYQYLALEDHIDCINNKSVRLLTNWKWRKFARKIFGLMFLMYLFTVFCLTFVAVTSVMTNDVTVYDTPLHHARAVCEVIMIVCVIMSIALEVTQLFRSGYQYFWDLFNVIEMSSAVLLLLVVPLRFLAVDVHWYPFSVGYGLWLCIIFKYAFMFRSTGFYAQILWCILKKDVVQFSVLFLVVNLVFAGTFLLALKADVDVLANSDTSSFYGILYVGIRTLVEGQPVIDYTGENAFGITSTIVLLLFLFLTVVILLNILIAQVNNTYQNIQDDADRSYELSLAKAIAWVEINGSILPQWKRWRCDLYKPSESIENVSKILDSRNTTQMEDVKKDTDSIIQKQSANEARLQTMMTNILKIRCATREGVTADFDEKLSELMALTRTVGDDCNDMLQPLSYHRKQTESTKDTMLVCEGLLEKIIFFGLQKWSSSEKLNTDIIKEEIQRLNQELRKQRLENEDLKFTMHINEEDFEKKIKELIDHQERTVLENHRAPSKGDPPQSWPNIHASVPKSMSSRGAHGQNAFSKPRLEYDIPEGFDETDNANLPVTEESFYEKLTNMPEHKLLGDLSSGAFKQLYNCLNLTDKDETALHIAAARGFYHVVKHLLSNEADVKALDEDNKLAVEKALDEKHDLIAALILHHGGKEHCRVLFSRPDSGTPPRLNIMDYLKEDNHAPKFLATVLDSMADESTLYYTILEADHNGCDPYHPDFDESQDTVFQKIARLGDKSIISQTAVESLIFRKWDNFARGRFFFQMVMFLICLTSLTSAAVMGIIADDVRKYDSAADGIRAVFEALSYAFMLFICLPNEILEFKNYKKKLEYFQSFDLLELLSCLLILAALPVRFTAIQAHWYMLSIGYLLWTFNIFKYATVFQQYGAYAQVLWLIIKTDVVQFSVLFAVVNLIFTGTYFLALKADDSISVNPETRFGPKVEDLGVASGSKLVNDITVVAFGLLRVKKMLIVWLKHICCTFHGILYAGLQTVTKGGPVISYADGYGYFSVVIQMMFLFVTLVILLNILIAQLSNTYTNIQVDAQRELCVRMARIIVSVERGVWACSRQTDVKNYYTPHEKVKDTRHKSGGNLITNIDSNLRYIGDKQVTSQMNLRSVKTEVSHCTKAVAKLTEQTAEKRWWLTDTTAVVEKIVKDVICLTQKVNKIQSEASEQIHTHNRLEEKIVTIFKMLDKQVNKGEQRESETGLSDVDSIVSDNAYSVSDDEDQGGDCHNPLTESYRVRDTEQRASDPEQQVSDSEQRVSDAEHPVSAVAEQGSDTERRVREAEQRVRDAEQRVRNAEQRLRDSEQRAIDTERQIRDMEQRVIEAKHHESKVEEQVSGTEQHVSEDEHQGIDAEHRVSEVETHVKKVDDEVKKDD